MFSSVFALYIKASLFRSASMVFSGLLGLLVDTLLITCYLLPRHHRRGSCETATSSTWTTGRLTPTGCHQGAYCTVLPAAAAVLPVLPPWYLLGCSALRGIEALWLLLAPIGCLALTSPLSLR